MIHLMRVGLLLWASFLWLGYAQAETRHIHLIRVFDSNNHDYIIREGCRSIGFGIDKEVDMLAAHLGIFNVLTYDVSGDNFSLAQLDKVLDYDMAYQERDIVIFVYVGHGFQEAGSPYPYPTLYFNNYDQSVNFSEIMERLQDKNPSVLMNVVVACNTLVTDFSTPPPYESTNVAPVVATLPKAGRMHNAYSSLFEEEAGVSKVINLFSADENYYTFLSADGGIFFNEILYTLQEVLSGRIAGGWQEVCDAIEERTAERSRNLGMQQQPLCEYVIRLSTVPVYGEALGRSFLAPTPCQRQAKNLRQEQKEELRQLRRMHREAMRAARHADADKNTRRLLAQEQRVAYESKKLLHEKEYQRQLLACR
ncbi:MAG: hypothetical protein R2795_02640 [Saprospiraceae bacterium]